MRSKLLLCGTALLSACHGLPIKETEVFNVSQAGQAKKVSAGDPVYVRYECPCKPAFVVSRDVDVLGRPPLLAGTRWSAVYTNTENGDLYLYNDVLRDSDYGVPLRNGRMFPDAAVMLIRGRNGGEKKWPLVHSSDSDAFAPAGFDFDRLSWEVIYIGPDRVNPRVLRFSIEEVNTGLFGHKAEPVEVTHNLDDGNDVVIRGVHLRIDRVGSDGTVDFTVLSEAATS